MAAGAALLRHPRVRRQCLHGRGSGPESGRGAPRAGRSRGALRRRLGTRDLHGRWRGARRAGSTLVHCPPGTLRGAIAAEPKTTVLGIGAKPGEVFQPSGWEWTFAGNSLLTQGKEDEARAEFQAGLEAYPGAWQGHYNLACAEAKLGNSDAALEQLELAAEIDRAAVAKWAFEDEDLDSLRGDPRFLAITGQSETDGTGS